MEIQKRKPIRLRDYDYGKNGAYFITICINERKPLLSRIAIQEGFDPPLIELLPFGKIAKEQLLALQNRYPTLSIDHYVIMPNHIHILMHLNQAEGGPDSGGASPSPTVSDIICAYKSLTTRECRKIMLIDKLFQRSFYDHIIRDDYDYQIRWRYIDENPIRWREDSLYIGNG